MKNKIKKNKEKEKERDKNKIENTNNENPKTIVINNNININFNNKIEKSNIYERDKNEIGKKQATTKMSEAAIRTMVSVMEENYGNPSSLYGTGQRAKETLEEARKAVAETIGADLLSHCSHHLSESS